MKKNFISVLLPVYNAEKYLAETLDSLLRQTYKEFEIIAINDGSTDSSILVLKEYAARDKRIQVISQKNQGIVATLNRAAELAKGEFLARIDADDLALPRRFELQIKAIKADSSIVLVAGGFDVMNEDGEILYHDAVPSQSIDLLNAMRTRNPIAHGSVLIRKEAFDKVNGYNSDCGPTEDYDLWMRLAQIGKIVALPQTIFRWRVNPLGITSTKSELMEYHMRINLKKFRDEHPYTVVSRSELQDRLKVYMTNTQQHGIATKERVLEDTVNASMALIKDGSTLQAISQLLIVASTGRTGYRFVYHRIIKAVNFRLNKVKH